MLRIWVVYKYPSDHPDKFVARMWIGEMPTMSVVVSESLELLQDEMMQMGLVKLMPSPKDDPIIVETWL
jgi:hypothetical protein